MKRLARVVAVVLIALVLLVAALFLYLKFVFDPNDFRARIGEVVEAQTGRKLSIEGDLELSVFPWLGVRLGAASLAAAASDEGHPFASIRAAQVRALLMPLLSGQLEVDRVVLDGLVLNLARSDKGVGNWEDLARAGGPAKTTGEPAGEASKPAQLPSLVFGGLSLRDATIHWDDRQAGRSLAVEEMTLETGRLEPGRPMALQLAARLRSPQPALDGTLALNGDIVLDPAGGRHAARGLELEFDGSGAALPGGRAKLELAADIAADQAAGTARVDGLRVSAYGMTLSGTLEAAGLDAQPRLHGELALAPFEPKAVAAALGIVLPPARDREVLRQASLDAVLEASADSVKLSDIRASLDDSKLEGTLLLHEFGAPALSFELAMDVLDVDRYLPAESADGGGAAAGDAGKAPVGPLIPPGPKVDGRFRLAKLAAGGLHLSDIDLHLAVLDGRARLQPRAALYDGKYAGDIVLDGRGKLPAMTLDEKLSGVRIGPLTRDLSGKEERVTGRADITARLQARGGDAEAIKRSLTGDVKLNFANGALKGINVAAFMRRAEAVLTGQPMPEDSGPNETDFTDLAATVMLKDGVASNSDLVLRSPLLRVGGEGSANLVTERIDYLVRATIVGTLTGQGGKPLEKVKGLTVPIRVSGAFDDPKYALDADRLLKDNLKAKVGEKREEIKQKAQEKLKEELQKGLKNLFK